MTQVIVFWPSARFVVSDVFINHPSVYHFTKGSFVPPRTATPTAGTTDAAFKPVPVNVTPDQTYLPKTRHWQGIPTIERAANGRLWVSWYSGGVQEDNDNYVVLATSNDDGKSFVDPVAVIDPPDMTRAFDSCLWHDPSGKLWMVWSQTCPMHGEVWDGRGGVWASTADDSSSDNPKWSAPTRLGHGIALNKPIFLANGLWVLPVSLWWFFEQFKELDPMRKPGVLVSEDQGKTWQWRGGAHVEHRAFDEPMVVEKKDGTLWMLIRTKTGIFESFSMDQGHSWSHARPSMLAGPSSRFFIQRLASGRLLLINHLGNPNRGRAHLTAMLSEDDGVTWPHRLLLDERERVSYPDAVAAEDGRLWIVYDRSRHDEREILMAKITEADILAGKVASGDSQLKILVSKAGV